MPEAVALASLPLSEEPPSDPIARLDKGCNCYVEIETRIWERAFRSLGREFDREAFQREAASLLQDVIRTALFHGANLTLEEFAEAEIGNAHCKAAIDERVELMRHYGTFDEKPELRLVD